MARDPFSRRNLRRMRRAQRSGDNPFGVYIVGPRDSLALLALSALSRWAFRHRSAFAPLALALAAFITAGMIHQHHAQWWRAAVAVTATAAVALGFPHSVIRRRAPRAARFLARAWALLGIDRAQERAYAATVAACAGGWMSAATAIGPAVKPLPVTAVILTGILGIPWWFHRRRRAKVRVESTVSAWPAIAEEIGLAGARITSVTVDTWGWTARVILRRGTTAESAIQKIPAIESGIGTRPGSVRVFPDADKANALTLRVTEKDPHGKPAEWPGTTTATITRPVGIGVSEDGRPVSVSLLRRHALIGGTTGAGKSGIVNVIIAALAACYDAVIWGIDMKGGMELQPWQSCFARLATTPDEANGLFRDAVRELNRRAHEKSAQGVRTLNPSRNDPALVIVVDEYAELPEESRDCADSLARRGRAVAVTLIAATQRPTQAAMGKETAVRSLMDLRICLRVRERRDVDLILGAGSFASGWRAHQFTKPGEFMIGDPEHSTPEKHRAYLISDERITRHAAECAPGRPALPGAAPDTPCAARRATESGETAIFRDDTHGNGAEAALRRALRAAGSAGVTIGELMAATGMPRPTLYRHLQALARTGHATQVTRGHWRSSGDAAPPDSEGR